jgi:uncharacterized protein (DUF362 family)
MSLVSLVKTKDGTVSSYKNAINSSLSLIGEILPKQISNVVIKPNMCYYWDYTTGQTTDPKFVAALIEVLRENTSVKEIAVVESDASAMKCKYAFKFLGYERIARDYGIRLLNLSQGKNEKVTVPCNGHSFSFLVPEIIKNSDLRINIPKIKYMTRGIELTCALKNIYGCNPYPLKYKYHPQLADVIVALNKVMKFNLCLIESNIASGVQPRRMGLVMASKDPVAIDAAAGTIAGIKLNRMKYLEVAEREGLGTVNFVTKGEPIASFEAMYPKRTLKKRLMSQGFIWINRLRLGKKLGLG